MTETTTTARRIARRHNQACNSTLTGGILAFDRDGQGGEWYSAQSQPDAEILFGVRARRVTAREVQEWLDMQAEDALCA